MYKQVLKYFPAPLRKRLNTPSGQKIFQNIIWLYGDKIFRLGGGLLVGIIIARYLGPTKYGLYNFAFSFVWIFENVVTLGMNEVLMREVVIHPEKRHEILGSSFTLRVCGATIALGVIVLGIFLLRPEPEVRWIVAIMALGMMIKNAGVIKFFFEARVQSKYSVIAENISYVFFLVVKVVFIITSKPLIYFVWAYSLEAVLSSFFYIYYYQKTEGRISRWKFNTTLAAKMIGDSWILIFTGLCIMIYVRIDQVLIAQLKGDGAAGIYSAAVRISELWFFIPSTILVSFFPSITVAREKSNHLYMERMQQLFDIISVISIAIALPLAVFAPFIISMLYGEAYNEAALVLTIHVWSATFLVLMVASARYFIVENLQKHLFLRSLFGAVLNIALNFLLIPQYGPAGAAIATLLSYALAAFSTFFFSRTRALTMMMFASFNFYRIFNQYLNKKSL